MQQEYRLQTGREVGLFILERVRAIDDVIMQVAALLRDPAFARAFGASDDETTADPDAILRAAHRLGDYYERLLELTEEFRKCSVADQYEELFRDSLRFVNQPLKDFGGFVNDVLERLDDMQKGVILGQPYRWFGPITLTSIADGELAWSIMDRVLAIM